MYDFTSRAFYFHPGKTMADFSFGFSDASLTDGCSLSIALLRTEKTDWFNRHFWDVTMEWYPGNEKSTDVCTGARVHQIISKRLFLLPLCGRTPVASAAICT